MSTSDRDKTHSLTVTQLSLPEKYVQVGAQACEDVPPGVELRYDSNTRGERTSAGSEGPDKYWPRNLK